MLEFIVLLGIGFAGSLHCLGMCGPIVLAYSLHVKGPQRGEKRTVLSPWRHGVVHHMAFHSGRLATYGLLGVLGAGVVHLADSTRVFADIRGCVSLAGGSLMILLGLMILKIASMPASRTLFFVWPVSLFQRRFSRLLQSRGLGSKFGLGLTTGFLPCGLSWAMIVKGATTQNMAGGFMTMVAFGLGTVPALLLIGLSATVISVKMRILGERVAAVSVIAIGAILVFKGANSLV